MRDFRKFGLPRTTKNPSIGDVLVEINKELKPVSYKDFKSISKFFKINSFYGESQYKIGNLEVENKDFGKSAIFSPEDFKEDKFIIKNIIGNKNPEVGDIQVYNPIIDQEAVFSFEDWINSTNSWEIVGLYGIKTYKEEETVGGEYVISANGTTFIIKPKDYSKIKSNWKHVDTISKSDD